MKGITTMEQLYFDDVAVGDALPGFTVTPTTVQMMRYCGVTWNTHRIHFDPEQAAAEGYPGVLVQSHLHQAFLTKLVTDWIAPRGELRRLTASVRRFAVAGDTLVLRGRVVATSPETATTGLVTLEIEEARPSDGVVCAPGTAVIALPIRS